MPRYVEKGSQKPTEKQAICEAPQKTQEAPPADKPIESEAPKEAQKPRKKYIEKGADYKEPVTQPTGATDEQAQPTKNDIADQTKKVQAPNPKKQPESKGSKKNYDDKPRKENYRPQRNNRRSKYDWNRRNITLETVVPDMPKTILKKPDEPALDKKIKELKDKIRALDMELKDKKDSKQREIKAARQEKTSFNKLSSANLAKLRELKTERRKQWTAFDDLVKSQKSLLVKLKELRTQENNFRSAGRLDFQSKGDLKVRRDRLENELITKELTAKERKRVQDEINECDRHLVNARQDYELDLEHGKVRDIINIEQLQLDRLNSEITVIRGQLNRLDGEIKTIESINESEEKTVQRVRSREEIEEEFETERQRLLDAIYALEDEINSLEDAYRYELEDFREQEELIEWIKFAQDEKKFIKEENEKYERLEKERKAEQERRKKERERELAEKQRKKEEWEKKKKEREEREKRYEEELQRKLNSLPFSEQKKLCAFLKEYCQKLKPQTEAEKKQETSGEIVLTGEWQKETKKGAKLIRNKKEQEEVNELDITRNQKKPEKKVEKKTAVEDAPFDHTIHMIRLFESIHVPPPVKVDSLDQTIEAIDKRLEYYQNPSEEDIRLHRERVAAEHNRQEAPTNGQVRPERKQERENRPPRLAQCDFPAL